MLRYKKYEKNTLKSISNIPHCYKRNSLLQNIIESCSEVPHTFYCLLKIYVTLFNVYHYEDTCVLQLQNTGRITGR